MEEIFKKYEKSIKKKHRFSWTPKFKEEFRTKINQKVFIPIAEKAFEKLGWNITYIDDNLIKAKYKTRIGSFSEIISVNFNFGQIEVESKSLGNEFWDNGRNSKRVKLFIYAFNEIEKEFDENALNDLEKEVDRKDNWDEYIIPEKLPNPNKTKKPSFDIAIIIGTSISLMLGFFLAEISVRGFYVFGLIEFLVILVISYSLKYLIKFSNFTNYSKLDYLIIGMVILTFFSTLCFQYLILVLENDVDKINLFELTKLRYFTKMKTEILPVGWIGLFVVLGIQMSFAYLLVSVRLFDLTIKYQLSRVPMEVVDFAFYHFAKEKTEADIRKELATKGWTNKQNQDEVFEAIDAINDVKELNRLS